MAKLTKVTLFKTEKPRPETLMDKITRAAMDIVDDEKAKRDLKTDRLRKARLEREASGPGKSAETTAKGPGKTPRSKTPKPAKKT